MSRSDFLQEYMEEVREHLQDLESSLLVLEREGNDKEQLAHIFRATHSIKGASSYMGFEGLTRLTHHLESLINEIQVHSRPVTAKGINLLLECVDFISRALGNLEICREEPPLPSSLLNDLQDALSMETESVITRSVSEPDPHIGPSSTIAAASGKMDGSSGGGEQGERTGVPDQELEESDENELADIGPFLKSFRNDFWELVNSFALSSNRVLSISDFECAQELIERLIHLSRQVRMGEIEQILQEWSDVLREFHRNGRNTRNAYSDLLNTYGQRLQELLPTLELPFLAFDSENPPRDDDETQEEDTELLTIFADTFQQRFSELSALAPSEPEAILAEADILRACEIIDRLISSCRYMDYNDGIDLLKEFQVSLSQPDKSRQMDGRFYSDIIGAYGQHLQRALPMLNLSLPTAPSQEHPESCELTFEEEDNELLDIFLSSFQQNFNEMASLIPPLPDSLLTDTDVEGAGRVLGRLISSAHYMGYNRAIDVLKDWDISLGESNRSGRLNGRLYADILNNYGERLGKLLPTLRIPSLDFTPEHIDETDEIYPEHEDMELLSIFMDSLQQNFSELSSLSPPLPESILSDDDLKRALELIKRSVSSARYMDYGHVVSVLKEWDESLAELRRNGQVSSRLYSELLNVHGDRLRNLLPSLQIDKRVGDSGEEDSEEEDSELLSIFLASFEQSLSELASLNPPLPEGVISDASFERTGELLKRLISSAHYMDYDRFVDVLKEWERSFQASWKGGAASGRVYAEMFDKYGQPLEKMLYALKTRVDPLMGFENGKPAEPLGPRSPSPLIDGSDEPSLLSLSSIAEDVARELSSEGDTEGEMIAQLVGLPQEAPQPREPQIKERPRTGVAETKSEAIGTLRVNVQKVDQLLNQVMELVVRRSELVDTATVFMSQLKELTSLGKLAKEDLKKLRSIGLRLNELNLSLGRVATDLQDSVMRVRMLPISQLFMRFPRVVRDQALKIGKKAELVFSGGETEIDKHIIEQMYDPLVQFLRNAIAHGIESPEERRAAGKPELGIIRMSAYQEGDYVVLDIVDDGRGIDTLKLGKILKKHSKMSAHDVDRLSHNELIQAIFLPGISTHGLVDSTAGRGVGLDVVKENVERMNGTIEVESEIGVGTRFTIRIPLTVAIIKALLVRGVNQVFALPLNAVSQILRYRQEDIHTIEGFQVIQQRGKTIPLVRLNQLFGVSDDRRENSGRFIVVVTTTFREVGLIVEGLRGEREIVIKPIEDELHTFEGFSGATILGDGTVSLIMDVSGLLRNMQSRLGMPQRRSSPYIH